MEPKLKAEELVERYDFLKEIFIPSIHEQKKCALIAVDEVLKEYWPHNTKRIDYWIEVKTEIEKL